MNTETRKKIVEGFDGNAIVGPVAYNLSIGGFLLYGCLFTLLMCTVGSNLLYSFFYGLMSTVGSMFYLVFIIGYFALAMGGQWLMASSKSIGIRLLGYHMMLVPISAILFLVVASLAEGGYDPNILTRAMLVTGSITIMMTALSVIMPDFFLKIGRTLMAALFIAIIAQFIMSFMAGGSDILDWSIVIIFAGFIGYDWSRGQQYPMTVGNSIFVAASLYLDMVNILIRLISIFSRRR